MLSLSGHLGNAVRDASGERVGSLADLAVRLADPYPVVTRVSIKRDRRTAFLVAWEDVAVFEHPAIQLRKPAEDLTETQLGKDELLLGKHVLDTQIVDVAGKRLVRVADVELVREGDELWLVGVDVGFAAVLRRLGLGWLARRATSELVDWRDLHLASARGHMLQLQTKTSSVHRLTPDQLTELVARLPVARGAEVMRTVKPEAASKVLGTEPHKLGDDALHELIAKRTPRRRRFRIMKARRRAPS